VLGQWPLIVADFASEYGIRLHAETDQSLTWLVFFVYLTGLMVALTLRYFDRVQPSTKWEVVIYVDERADDDQLAALAAPASDGSATRGLTLPVGSSGTGA